MRSRILVAAMGIPAVYLLTWAWNATLPFALLVAAMSVLAVSELNKMLASARPFAIVGLTAAAVTPLVTHAVLEPGLIAAALLALPLTLIFTIVSTPRLEPLSSVTATVFPVFYIVIPASLLVAVRETAHGFELILLLLAGTWLSDTGAYFGGRAFGRRKLAPTLSPNKTVEGLVCGIIAGTVAVWFGHYFAASQEWGLSGGEAIAMGLAVSIAAPLGDLFESMIKRTADVKDSGHLLGEHGGVLDRIDALLFSGPAIYLLALLTGAL